MHTTVGNERQDPFRATKIWNALIEHVRTEVDTKRRRWKLQYFEDCFRGCDLIRVLRCYVQSHPQLSKDASRSQLRCLCQILLESNVIERVPNSGKEECFEDNGRLFRFVSKRSDCSPGELHEKKNKRKSFDRVLKPILSNFESLKTPIDERKRKAKKRRSVDSLAEREDILPLKWRRRSLDVELSIRRGFFFTAKDIDGFHQEVT